IAGVNHPRGGDMLVVYTARFGGGTPAGPGIEITVAPESLPLRCGEYRGAVALRVNTGTGGTPIPESGLVIAGSGAAARSLKSVAPGEQLEFRIDFEPELHEDDEVIGGGPRLVRNGAVSVEDEARIVERTQGHRRLPRSAVGIRGRTAFLATIDGRRRAYSAG